MVAGSLVSFRAARYLIRDDRIYPFAIAVVIGGLFGARVAHVLDNWNLYAARPLDVLAFWNGGIGTTGAPVGATIAGFLMARWLRLPVGFMFDISVIGIALGEAIGRVGDIINGEHHATACTPPEGLCVGFTHPDTLGQPGPVHLVVAYDMIWDLSAVALTLWLRRYIGRWPDGVIFWIWALHYAVGRFFLGFLRIGDPTYAFGLRQDQTIALLVFAAAITVLFRLTTRSRAQTRTFAV
jgi:prolipoprotein diacylglyceryl transferase